MRRRDFITLLGGATAWPLAARAQQARQPARIGFLRAAPPPDHIMAALRRGLSEHGYHEGTTFVLVPSWGDGNLDRLPELANSLVSAGVDIILSDGTSTAHAAHAATVNVSIVMAGGNDPVQAGLATSLARPGGNVTGFTTQVIELTGKTFEVATEILPGIVQIGVINPRGVGEPFRAAEAEAAKALGLQLAYVEIGDLGAEGIDQAIRRARDKVQAAVVRGSPFLSSVQRKLIVERAAFHRLPTIYEMRDFVELGGLASYGTDFTELFRLAAGYIVKILNGSQAGELPIQQATKFELVVNLRTARALALVIPATLLTRRRRGDRVGSYFCCTCSGLGTEQRSLGLSLASGIGGVADPTVSWVEERISRVRPRADVGRVEISQRNLPRYTHHIRNVFWATKAKAWYRLKNLH